MSSENSTSSLHCHGFRCKSGCVHIVLGSTMFSLTTEQFLTFVDVINNLHGKLLEEEGQTVIAGEQDSSDSLLM